VRGCRAAAWRGAGLWCRERLGRSAAVLVGTAGTLADAGIGAAGPATVREPTGSLLTGVEPALDPAPELAWEGPWAGVVVP
jgi:hypothetical protein